MKPYALNHDALLDKAITPESFLLPDNFCPSSLILCAQETTTLYFLTIYLLEFSRILYEYRV